MRILVVSQYFWPENFRINDLVADLVKRGHLVTVLTGLPNYPEGKVFQEYRDAALSYKQYEGAEIVRVPMAARGQNSLRLFLNYLTFAVSASTVGVWKLRRQKFDVIFAYEPSPITVGLPAVAMRRVKRAPLAFWVLDLWPETLEALHIVRSRVLLKMVGKLVTFIYFRCDLILAQSRSFIPQIQKYAKPNGNIVYFPNWAEPAFTSGAASPHEVSVPSGGFNVMFAGNIGDAQDFPAILDAANMLREHTHIRWIIIGDGRAADWLAEEIKKRNLQTTVFMLGRHHADKMPAFFQQADALLVSLKKESIFAMTIPGKLQSYLAAGKPILAMLDGEGAYLVESSGAGIACGSGDSAGLASATLALSELSNSEREKMGQRGLLVSTRDFNRNKLVEILEEHLMRIHSAAQL